MSSLDARTTLSLMLVAADHAGGPPLARADFLMAHQAEWLPEVLAQIAANENWEESAPEPEPDPGIRECALSLANALRRRVSR